MAQTYLVTVRDALTDGQITHRIDGVVDVVDQDGVTTYMVADGMHVRWSNGFIVDSHIAAEKE